LQAVRIDTISRPARIRLSSYVVLLVNNAVQITDVQNRCRLNVFRVEQTRDSFQCRYHHRLFPALHVVEAFFKSVLQQVRISRDKVHICEGQPTRVIADVTKAVNADIIVMGARNIGRLERLVSSVTVEPVLAEMNCDILVVKDRDLSGVPKAAAEASRGTPKYDLEHAILDPENTFESPLRVANVSEISIELRQRILQAWEFDIRAEMEAENEGGAVGDINVNVLDQIISAKELLRMKEKSRDNESMRLSRKSA